MLESLFLNKSLKIASPSTSKLDFARCCVPLALTALCIHSQGPSEDHCWEIKKNPKTPEQKIFGYLVEGYEHLRSF